MNEIIAIELGPAPLLELNTGALFALKDAVDRYGKYLSICTEIAQCCIVDGRLTIHPRDGELEELDGELKRAVDDIIELSLRLFTAPVPPTIESLNVELGDPICPTDPSLS